eukprot:335173-Pyramimonas_sp.AAC.1
MVSMPAVGESSAPLTSVAGELERGEGVATAARRDDAGGFRRCGLEVGEDESDKALHGRGLARG